MDCEQKTLITELTQGKELAELLRNNLNSISSLDTRQFLVEQILSSYEKALFLLNWGGCAVEIKPTISTLESPNYFANSSPKSDVSDQDCKDQCQKDVYKKRKTEPRWTEQVKVCSVTGLEGPLEDGYNWRKYGQKDILGANFPRGYYRCTHRHSQGCLATKQVQKSDQDPTIFEVTYRGRHTCLQASRLAVALSPASLKNDKSKQDKDSCQVEQPEQKPKPLKELSFNFREVKSQDSNNVEDIFPLFSFPDAYIGNGNEENDIFKESMMENDFLSSLSSAFISPATSDSSCFAMTPCHMNSLGIDHNVRTPESNLAPTSATNSPNGYWDISLDNVDFDTNFPLDNPELFT
ncbi:hypothetical protein GH714_038661 [Hevea brasiliensis]|uniref:WRKY domain-containing protein n=1 Tax=Hevea brasiliensis TaxID=3981 RepID=A0A6A6MND3_HEVBR|nr:hypothetical protein GH714_038661 [Hevea brasiliensis]